MREVPYTLQAAIAACHACAFHPDETDWDELVDLYTELARTTPSPIVELNRAVAISMSSGPAEALALVDVLVATGTLDRYHLLAGVRGNLLERLGRHAEAAREFERAAEPRHQRRRASAALVTSEGQLERQRRRPDLIGQAPDHGRSCRRAGGSVP